MPKSVVDDPLFKQKRILKSLNILKKTTSNLGFAYVNPKASTRRNIKPGFYVKNSGNFWKHIDVKSFVPPIVNEAVEMSSNNALLEEGNGIVGELQALELRLAYYAKQVAKCKIGIATELMYKRTGKLHQKFAEAKDFFRLLRNTSIQSDDEAGPQIKKTAKPIGGELSLSDSSSDESEDSRSDSEREDGEMTSDEEVPKRVTTPVPQIKPTPTPSKSEGKGKEKSSVRKPTPEKKDSPPPPPPPKKPKEKPAPASKEPPIKKKKKTDKHHVASTSKEPQPTQRSDDPDLDPNHQPPIIELTAVGGKKAVDPRSVRSKSSEANSSTYHLISMPSAKEMLVGTPLVPDEVPNESLLAKFKALEKENARLLEEKELRLMKEQREHLNDKRRRSHR